jgi:hypothetical protein
MTFLRIFIVGGPYAMSYKKVMFGASEKYLNMRLESQGGMVPGSLQTHTGT